MAVSASMAVPADRIAGALWGLYIGDALASPSHWYYGGARQIQADYGKIQGYVKPKMELMGSIMNKSNTGGGGRGSDSGTIIGEVINHGKEKYWSARGSYHYHCTLDAGENTLEACLARLVTRSITSNGGCFDPKALQKAYVDFMTTPGTHNDCYASTCHRMFFGNMRAGKPLDKCPDNDRHNVDVIDGLTMPIPVILATLSAGMPESVKAVQTCVGVTRNSRALEEIAPDYVDLFRAVLGGQPLEAAVQERGWRIDKRGADPMVA